MVCYGGWKPWGQLSARLKHDEGPLAGTPAGGPASATREYQGVASQYAQGWSKPFWGEKRERRHFRGKTGVFWAMGTTCCHRATGLRQALVQKAGVFEGIRPGVRPGSPRVSVPPEGFNTEFTEGHGGSTARTGTGHGVFLLRAPPWFSVNSVLKALAPVSPCGLSGRTLSRSCRHSGARAGRPVPCDRRNSRWRRGGSSIRRSSRWPRARPVDRSRS